MKKKTIVVMLCIFLVTMSISVTAIPDNNELQNVQPSLETLDGNTLYVGGSGPGNYSVIQEAIDDAEDGDTVFVYDDSSPYYGRIIIQKEIKLLGESKYTTVINGYQLENVIFVKHTKNVQISGFTICNPADKEDLGAGIRILNSDFIEVSRNIIRNNPKQGIILESTKYCKISDNKLIMNKERGILIFKESVKNEIINNNIKGSNVGIKIVASSNKYSGNKITACPIGISIFGHYNILINNIIMFSLKGIEMTSSHENKFARNTLLGNIIGFYFVYTVGNIFFENNFILNPINGYHINLEENIWIHNYWKRPRAFPKLVISPGYHWETGQLMEYNIEIDSIPAKKPFLLPILDFPEDPFDDIDPVLLSTNSMVGKS